MNGNHLFGKSQSESFLRADELPKTSAKADKVIIYKKLKKGVRV